MSASLKSLFATLPKTQRGQRIVINGDPKGKNFLYVNGNSVVIRNIDNPEIADVYTEHSTATTCAKYSPSGYYIASADVSGKVRIWDTVNKEHILKNEFQPFAGCIKDISWSSDNTKIAVGGEGREKFGHVFNAETGTSVGTIMGHSKCVNGIDFKPTRPFRLATASDDLSVAFFEGPPFKFKQTTREHTRFVNSVRYSPDGSIYVSCGADGKLIVYDGKDGNKISEIGSPAHAGGIYGISFSEDSKSLLSVSGDKTAKIWDIQANSVVTTFDMGKAIEDMQVGCLWQGSHLLTVSLSGYINYLDKNNPSTPLRIIKGHNLPITSLAVTEDKSAIFSASSDGAICRWRINGDNEMLNGSKHDNKIQKINIVRGKLISCSMDDTIAFSDVSEARYGDKVKLQSQPRGMSTSPSGLTVVASTNHISILMNGSMVKSVPIDFEGQSSAVHPHEKEFAVCGGDSKLRIYSYDDSFSLTIKREIVVQGVITDMSYSPDGTFLGAASSGRPIYCFRLPDYEDLTSSQWVYHTARVNSVCWSDDGKRLFSGGIDTNAFIWDPANTHSKTEIKGKHPMAIVNTVGWLDNNTVVTGADDGCVRVFTV
ncbi:DgyrCDS5367 [Dimorphilus gyrociliatus]|uniref:Actin-interacting protein 1 n=1 Tax=Dimorphilus gyrociliatus TaxID=2664684 RepID=A0A7I8VJT3_9ANNE|nr:DgyrCDS5367 [Dimorphilus gyrociliatus]